MTKRIYGIDLLKVLACSGVVALHTVNGSLGIVNRIVTIICSLSIPTFFMCSGYVAFLKSEISYHYVLKKINKIVIVCFGWEILHAIAYFLYYHDVRNFVESFFLDFLQKGLFFHFWFMGVLIILYLLLPILRVLKMKMPMIYAGILVGMCVICICIDGINMIIGYQANLSVVQTFRLWQWLFYYMLGGFFATCENKRKINIEQVGIALSVLVVWLWLVGEYRFGKIEIEGFYGSVPVIGATICIFLFFYQAKFNSLTIKLLKLETSCIMGVYIIHPFIGATLSHFIPLLGIKCMPNLMCWIITILISVIISWAIGKIPLISELIKI